MQVLSKLDRDAEKMLDFLLENSNYTHSTLATLYLEHYSDNISDAK